MVFSYCRRDIKYGLSCVYLDSKVAYTGKREGFHCIYYVKLY